MSTANPLDTLAFPLTGTGLIEASAGTGKTYTIAALYVRLILGHAGSEAPAGTPLLPPEILVVTFTEAATKELRERIRERLSQAARYFRGQSSSADDFLSALRQDYPADSWPGCARLLELAANWMDEASVFTIHSWCNRMLQQHAFDSGSLFVQEVNTHDSSLLQEVVRDYWRSFFYPLPENTCQAIQQLLPTPETLGSALQNLLHENEAQGLQCSTPIAELFAQWQAWESSRQSLLLAARKAWTEDLQALNTLLIKASSEKWLNGNSYRQNTFAQKLTELNHWAQHGDSLETEALAKFSARSLTAGLVKAHQDKAAQFEHPALLAMDSLVTHLDKQIDLQPAIIMHALHWIRDRYTQEKQRIARITFDDMLTRLDQALQGANGAQLTSVIRQQYPIALIDEFQDTDPVQYRIFSTLYPTNPAATYGCFMIGDPKQAIYSFRGADIFTYLKAYQDTLGHHYTLDTNFRSTQGLVQAVNQIFSFADQQAQGAFRFKDGTQNPLPFHPVAANGRKDSWVINAEAAPALTLWHWQSEDAIGLPAYREHMAAVTASEIVRLLHAAQDGRTGFKSDTTLTPLQPGDLAILVRTGLEAKIMRRALARRQVRSVYLSERDSIYASAEAGDLLFWLKAMAEPLNEQKVRAALSTATFGWSYQELQALNADEPLWEQHLERFLRYQQYWQQDGILPALRHLLAEYALPQKLRADTEGERVLTNLLHLAELLQQASIHLEGSEALVRFLAEAIADPGSADSDATIMRLESDANLIKIITIHKSKGLEYPLVFLPFICSYREVSARNAHYYRYHDAQQQLTIDLLKSNTVQALSDAERLQEDLRLVYVALTRARYACWLGMAPIRSGGKACQLERSAMGALLGWQKGMAAAELGTQLQLVQGDCPAISICELPAATDLRYQAPEQHTHLDAPRTAEYKITNPWWVASYSSLTATTTPSTAHLQQEFETAQADQLLDESDSQPPNLPALSGIHGIARGAATGTLIHSLLEKCALQEFALVAANETLQQELVLKTFPASVWESQYPVLQNALQHWLSMPLLTQPALSLRQLERSAYQAEWEFLLGAEGVHIQALDQLLCEQVFPGLPRPALQASYINGLLKGFIDLVFVHEQQYYLLDYKFNSLGNCDADYTEAALTQAMLQKRYDVQACLYLLALHRLLSVRLGEAYDYARDLGGCVYVFLRGVQGPAGGRVFYKPPLALLQQLEHLFQAGADV